MSDTPNFETCNMDVGCQEHEKCFAAQNGSPENCGAFGPVNGNKNDTSLENWFPYSAEELNRLERENADLRAKLEAARKDAERLAYLTADHDNIEVRNQRNNLLCRMPVMSHSAACADIDIGLSAIAQGKGEK